MTCRGVNRKLKLGALKLVLTLCQGKMPVQVNLVFPREIGYFVLISVPNLWLPWDLEVNILLS